MQRNQLLAGVLGVTVAAGGIGWFAGSQIASPAELAARAQAPEASLITAAVDEQVLSSQIFARGEFGFEDPVRLSLSGSIGGADTRAVVTKLPEVDTVLNEGSVALEVTGRPVIVLQGVLPVLRDYRPGAEGVDVLQLEQALVRLGYLSSADSTWTGATGDAVAKLYAKAGYSPNGATRDEQTTLQSARDRVSAASRSLTAANAALNNSGGASASAILQAEADVVAAQQALTVAQLQASANNAVATQAVTDAQTELDAAGPGDVAYWTNVRDNAVNDAAVVSAQGTADVTAAQSAVTIAQAILAEVQSPGDTSYLRQAVIDAKSELTNAQKDLSSLQSEIGTWIPAGELIFVQQLPITVTDLTTTIGADPTGSFLTAASAGIGLTLSLDERDARRIDVGSTVIVDDPYVELEEELSGSVSSIAENAVNGKIRVDVFIEDIPDGLEYQNVRVVIPISSTGGAVLVVPAAALSSVASGDVRVEVEDPENPGTTYFVTVTTGLAAEGLVQVTPVDGELKKGDRVVVGVAPSQRTDDAPDETVDEG